MVKKYIFGLLFGSSLFATALYAAPVLSLNGIGGDGNNVTVSIAGADGSSVAALYYTSAQYSNTQSIMLGNTDASGNLSATVNTQSYYISQNTPVYVVVNGYNSQTLTWPYNYATSSSPSAITLNPSTVTLAASSTAQVTLSGGTGNYIVTANTNPVSVQVGISGNILTITGSVAGMSTLTVCASNNTLCTTLPITVTGTASSVSLSPSSLSLSIGQSNTVSILGGSASYIAVPSNSSIVSTSLSGNMLTINALSTGTASVSVCATTGGCSNLMVTVASQATSPFMISIPIQIGQTMSLPLSGGNGVYTISNYNYGPFTANVQGTSLVINGVSQGAGTVNVCTSGSACTPVTFIVRGVATTNTYVPLMNTTTSKFQFSGTLSAGMNNSEVLALQKRLAAEGFLTATPNGYFGNGTIAAVKAYQKAHGLAQLGIVGPGTRAVLNQ